MGEELCIERDTPFLLRFPKRLAPCFLPKVPFAITSAPLTSPNHLGYYWPSFEKEKGVPAGSDLKNRWLKISHLMFLLNNLLYIEL